MSIREEELCRLIHILICMSDNMIYSMTLCAAAKHDMHFEVIHGLYLGCGSNETVELRSALLSVISCSGTAILQVLFQVLKTAQVNKHIGTSLRVHLLCSSYKRDRLFLLQKYAIIKIFFTSLLSENFI